jgi:hypothetical protein
MNQFKRGKGSDFDGEVPGSFLTYDPWHRLIGSIFEDSQIELHKVSKRMARLLHFVGGVIDEDEDEGRDASREQADQRRQWRLSKLKHLNRELYEQIGDMLQVKLQVIDAIEHLKMADLERSVEERLRGSLKLVKGGDKTTVGERPNNHSEKPKSSAKEGTLAERSTEIADVDWQPMTDDDAD